MSELIYPWHQPYWAHLSAYVKQQRIPQALLIKGKAGLGKQQLALHFAQFLMCLERQERSACHACESCRLFMAHTHPDFMMLQPEEPGKAIGVDLIRRLIAKLALKPQYSAYRVVLISPTEAMNRNAANAFLKCLEEPPERTLFLLVAEHSEQLPATIISRCQMLLLASPAVAIARQWLHTQGIAAQQQTSLLNLAQGAPLLALKYAQESSLEQYQMCFDDWQNILMGKSCPVTVAEKWLKSPELQLLQWLISWTEDLIKCYFHVAPALLRNENLHKDLANLAQRVDLKRLFDVYGLLLKDTHRIQTQLNKQLLFEELLITCSQSTRSH